MNLKAPRNLWYLLLLLLVFLLGCFDIANLDIWWHLRTGQLIWQKGAVPSTDWYTYTNPNARWIDLHWGFQLAVAALWQLGGAAALVLTKAAVGTATVAIALTIGSRGRPGWETAFCWLVPVLLMAGRYYVRPEAVSLLFLAVTLAILHFGRGNRRLFWLLPMTQVLWVNVQGLFVVQFVVIGCFLIDRCVRNWWSGWDDPNASHLTPSEWRNLSAVTAVTVGASCINPYGVTGAVFPLILFARVRGTDRTFFQQFVTEFDGVGDLLLKGGFASAVGDARILLLLLLTFAVVVTFVILLAHRRLNLYRLLLFTAFGYLAWQMNRNVVLFALIAGVVLRLNVRDLAEMGTQQLTDATTSTRRVTTVFAILLLSLIVSVPVGGFYRLVRWPRQFGIGQSRDLNHSAIEFLNQPGMPDYVFASDFGEAALCIFHLAPQKRVFADGRLEVHERETLERFQEIKRKVVLGDRSVERDLRFRITKAKIDDSPLPALVIDHYILLAMPETLDNMLRSPWRCVYCETKQTDTGFNPETMLQGASVFIDKRLAERLGMPEADVSPLLALRDWAMRSRR